jgi:RNA polymerase primary sigma factor
MPERGSIPDRAGRTTVRADMPLATRRILGYDDGVKKRTRGGEDDTLQAYLREISTFPSLTSEEERDLGRRIRGHRDQRAFRRLVESNLRVVVGCVRRYRGLGVVLLDLVEEANVGLMEAARRFDPERNGEFITYAQWWIREAIMHALAEHGHVFVAQRGAAPPLRGLRPGDLPPADRTAIDEAGRAFRGSGRAARLPDDGAVRRAIIEHLRDALYELAPRERDVIRLRLGLDSTGPLSLGDTGDRLRLGPDRVQEIERRARRKLRRSQKARELRSGLN